MLAFLVSLIAGVLIIAGGIFTSMVGIMLRSVGFDSISGFLTWPGMLGSGVGMLELGVGLMGAMGIMAGVMVIVGSVMLFRRPKKHLTWGSLIILFSFFSIYGAAIGGFGVGLFLGLTGGLLAITWKPKNRIT